ncbi:MAG: hypothetical protein IPP15_23405 [Saprospiraceae bacterium]|uniref:Uncharacterized protein n=1 Tax=Candidatus Opimibacter skivensis TaxID=2982028 RepID=A0A9D7XQ50_9BACT|nr:hypothetical protein [Candidatus Opimibacter skivensis]
MNDANALSYSIDKKLPPDTSWSHLASLSGSTNNYNDNAVSAGTIYGHKS